MFADTYHLQFSFAAIVVEYSGNGIYKAVSQDQARHQHIVRGRKPDIRISVVRDEPSILSGQVIYRDLLWRLVRAGNREQIVFCWPDNLGETVMCATREVGSDSWTYVFGQAGERFLKLKRIRHCVLPGSGVFEMLVLMEHLLRRGGLIIHASAVRLDSGTLVFGGGSGRGKSTMANLWSEAGNVMLSEESVAVIPQSGAWQCYGLPWGSRGRMSDVEPARVDSIYLLRHAAQNVVKVLTGARAFEALLQCVYLPFWDQGALSDGLEAVEALATEVTVCGLGFVPDARVVALLRDSSRGQ